MVDRMSLQKGRKLHFEAHSLTQNFIKYFKIKDDVGVHIKMHKMQSNHSLTVAFKWLTFLFNSQLAESFSLHWSARTSSMRQDCMNAPKVPRIVALSKFQTLHHCLCLLHPFVFATIPLKAWMASPISTAPAPCGRVKWADKYPTNRRTGSCWLEPPALRPAVSRVYEGGRGGHWGFTRGHIILSQLVRSFSPSLPMR